MHHWTEPPGRPAASHLSRCPLVLSEIPSGGAADFRAKLVVTCLAQGHRHRTVSAQPHSGRVRAKQRAVQAHVAELLPMLGSGAWAAWRLLLSRAAAHRIHGTSGTRSLAHSLARSSAAVHGGAKGRWRPGRKHAPDAPWRPPACPSCRRHLAARGGAVAALRAVQHAWRRSGAAASPIVLDREEHIPQIVYRRFTQAPRGGRCHRAGWHPPGLGRGRPHAPAPAHHPFGPPRLAGPPSCAGHRSSPASHPLPFTRPLARPTPPSFNASL
jgi:hypothetical protein